MITRRSFVERLGLGAGAALLGPLAGSLFSEAMGQTVDRRRVVLLLGGNGLHHDWLFTPPEVRALDPRLARPLTTREYTWPAALKSLEKYRSRALLLDGLTNVQQWGHTAGYAALSGIPAANGGSNENGGAPGGITIDQFIGQETGKRTPFKTVLVGAGRARVVFSSGPERPEAAFTDPASLYKSLFGVAADPRGATRQKLLFDHLRGGIRRLHGALAGPERLKLDHYLSSIESLERRARALMSLSCEAPGAPGQASGVEGRLEALVEIATLALACGMTQVVGISAGCGKTHGFLPYDRALRAAGLPAGTDWTYGHAGKEVQGRGMTAVFDFLSGLVARVADVLAEVREGNGSVLDRTTLVLMSDNAEQHHSNHDRWPLVVVGGGGTIRCDGRFIRYPLRGQPGYRALCDFYSTLAHAAGVPTDRFGEGGTEKVRGPLGEIM